MWNKDQQKTAKAEITKSQKQACSAMTWAKCPTNYIKGDFFAICIPIYSSKEWEYMIQR